jgi:hypothetical protein
MAKPVFIPLKVQIKGRMRTQLFRRSHILYGDTWFEDKQVDPHSIKIVFNNNHKVVRTFMSKDELAQFDGFVKINKSELSNQDEKSEIVLCLDNLGSMRPFLPEKEGEEWNGEYVAYVNDGNRVYSWVIDDHDHNRLEKEISIAMV